MQSKILVKEIKKQIKSKLNNSLPQWKKLTKKEKKSIVNDAVKEVVAMNKSFEASDYSIAELIGIESQYVNKDIISLNKIGRVIDENISNQMLDLIDFKRKSYIKNNELEFIDGLLDNKVLDALLAYPGFSRSMREFLPHQLLRVELLKCIKYPEISYRKFCSNEYFGMHQKENKAFVRLPINRKVFIDHTLLSKFRKSLGFHNLVNIMVYIIYHFQKQGFLKDGVIHGIDSTDLATTEQSLLCSITIKGHKVRIYSDLDADCGKRRNKKDKSTYVVGYRMHTLTAINPENGHNFPLISLLAPANHHDSLFAHPLISLAQAIGLDVKMVTADEAYHDSKGDIYKDTGATIIAPPNKKVTIPDFVDVEQKQVFCNKNCEVAMDYMGTTEENHHEFKCSANRGECLFAGSCPGYRFIPFDSGYFQRVHNFLEQTDQAIDIRKNSERPFNLLKNREGLKETRAKSQHGILARCIFAQMATLLIGMAGTRKKQKPRKKQEEQLSLPMAA